MEKIALVTGANQGLGLALVEGLSEKLGGDGLVYLTARDATKGEAALRELRRGAAGLLFERLDVTDEGNVSSLARTLRDRHGGLDVVISNAAARITRNVPPARQVRAFIETNNHGAYRMLKHFLPALREGGRFIVVASSFGTLKNLPPQLHQYFDVDSASLEDIDAAMDHYVAAVESGTAEAENWPEWINVPSKIGQVALAKVAARIVDATRPEAGISVNAACPGLVDTAAARPWFDDMSSAQSPSEAAKDILWLALEPHAYRGALIQHRKEIPWMAA